MCVYNGEPIGIQLQEFNIIHLMYGPEGKS